MWNAIQGSDHPHTLIHHQAQPSTVPTSMGLVPDRNGQERSETAVYTGNCYLWDLNTGAFFSDPIDSSHKIQSDGLAYNLTSFRTYSTSIFGTGDIQGDERNSHVWPVTEYDCYHLGLNGEELRSRPQNAAMVLTEPAVHLPVPLCSFDIYASNTQDAAGSQAYQGNDSSCYASWDNSYSFYGQDPSMCPSTNTVMSVANPALLHRSGDIPIAGASMADMQAYRYAAGHNTVYHSSSETEGCYDQESFRLTALSGVRHSSCVSSSLTTFLPHRRIIRPRPTPYSVMYRQEKSRAPIYNGDIHGGINTFHNVHVYNIDAAVLQYLKEHAATGAMHDSDERFPPPLCHPGTREAIIYRILNWYGYQSGPGKSIMWVHAPAGFGKTAVAGTVVEKLEEKIRELGFNPIGATFFFWRTSSERNHPARFIITLAYQLTISIPKLASHIERAIKCNPMILKKALETQLNKLIVEPFKALGDATNMPRRLIIIDGIDECINSVQETRVEKKYAEDQEIVQMRVLDLIGLLASYQLPLSFLILSRPETWIQQHLESSKFKHTVEIVNLYEVGDHLKDVEKFIREELLLLHIWEEVLIQCFLKKSGGHMVFASTVIRHIKNPYSNPYNHLQKILDTPFNSNPDLAHSQHFSSLHELYRQILQSCPEGNRPLMMEVLEELMFAYKSDCVIFGENIQDTIAIFDCLSRRAHGSGTQSLRGLHSVLTLEDSSKLFFHSTFPEFLQEPCLSKEFFVNWKKGCKRLLQGCLTCMSFITLDSHFVEKHVYFALTEWAWIWWAWCEHHEWKPGTVAPFLEMYEHLLRIDLMACFILHLTSIPSPLPTQLWWKSNQNLIIPPDKFFNSANFYSSQLLAQQAVFHVTSAGTAAILHLLDPTHLNPNQWSAAFHYAIGDYIVALWEEAKRVPTDWRSDAVVQALKTLQHGSLQIFAVFKKTHGIGNTIWDYIAPKI